MSNLKQKDTHMLSSWSHCHCLWNTGLLEAAQQYSSLLAAWNLTEIKKRRSQRW